MFSLFFTISIALTSQIAYAQIKEDTLKYWYRQDVVTFRLPGFVDIRQHCSGGGLTPTYYKWLYDCRKICLENPDCVGISAFLPNGQWCQAKNSSCKLQPNYNNKWSFLVKGSIDGYKTEPAPVQTLPPTLPPPSPRVSVQTLPPVGPPPSPVSVQPITNPVTPAVSGVPVVTTAQPVVPVTSTQPAVTLPNLSTATNGLPPCSNFTYYYYIDCNPGNGNSPIYFPDYYPDYPDYYTDLINNYYYQPAATGVNN